MSNNFPTYTRARKTGEAGVDAVSQIVHNELDWLFRKNNQDSDFGIDGFIDIVEDNGHVTGKTLAVQIKTGKSFFKSKTTYGFVFYGEDKHFNYYTNMHIPVILLLCDLPRKQIFWVHFDPQQTSQTNNGWKIEVLFTNVFGPNAKPALRKLVGPVFDHLQTTKPYWRENEVLSLMDYIHYAVDHVDIRRKNFKNIENLSKKLTRNNEIARQFQGRVQISVSGYDNDSRELWEIPEVVTWFNQATTYFKYWFFFLDTQLNKQGIILYFVCICGARRAKRLSADRAIVNVELVSEKIPLFMRENFIHLNELTDRLGMSIEENKAISLQIFKSLKMRLPEG